MKKNDYAEAVQKALCYKGNNFRLKKALERHDKKTTVAFLGGSITLGWNGKEILKDSYAVMTYRYLCEKYPQNDFDYLNLSTPSANSFVGLSILSKKTDDVLPDIVFVEYAVNNECSKEHMDAYESLVYRLLSLPSEPAVILVFTLNQSFYTSQGYMKRIGTNYQLPMISIADVIRPLVMNGVIEWSLYSDDWIHPNEWGHRFIFDCISAGIDTITADNDEMVAAGKPVYSLDYSQYTPFDLSPCNVSMKGYEKINAAEYFENALSYIVGDDDVFLRLEAEFKTLFIAYMHDKTEKYSDAEVYIDDQREAMLQGKSLYGWDNIIIKNICHFDVKAKHTVEIKIKDKSRSFVLAELGIC